jgi:hypothetical protein
MDPFSTCSVILNFINPKTIGNLLGQIGILLYNLDCLTTKKFCIPFMFAILIICIFSSFPSLAHWPVLNFTEISQYSSKRAWGQTWKFCLSRFLSLPAVQGEDCCLQWVSGSRCSGLDLMLMQGASSVLPSQHELDTNCHYMSGNHRIK